MTTGRDPRQQPSMTCLKSGPHKAPKYESFHWISRSLAKGKVPPSPLPIDEIDLVLVVVCTRMETQPASGAIHARHTSYLHQIILTNLSKRKLLFSPFQPISIRAFVVRNIYLLPSTGKWAQSLSQQC